MRKTLAIILSIICLAAFVSCTSGGNDGSACEHQFTLGRSSTEHWQVCTLCGETVGRGPHADEDGDGLCDVCSYVVNAQEHTHNYTYRYDADGHWRECACGDIIGRGPHEMSGNTCTVCGYTETVPEPATKLRFGDEVTRQNDAFYKDYTDEEKELYYTLWDENTSVTIKIDISPYELAKIDEAERSNDGVKKDTYRKCNLIITVNGQDYTYEEVGVRMRGNTSRSTFCNQNGDMYAYVHLRFSLTETFDGEEYEAGSWANELYHDWSADAAGRKERKDRSFATMEKFFFKWNKNYDRTYVREVYANRMFSAYGILAPHITLANILVKQNGNMENIGVCGLYEIIDKQFIKRNFDKENKGGDLYKCTYTSKGPADLTKASGYGIETAYETFSYDLKTNDDPEDFNNHKYLLALIDALNTRNQSEFETKLESMVDMDYFATFEAVNYLVGNPDCIRNNANNYYIYFTPAGIAYLIPYDYDRCFGTTRDWNPGGNGLTEARPYDVNGCNGRVNNPLYTRTILDGGIEKYRNMYKSKLQEVLDGKWFTYENFAPLYGAYKKNYESAAIPSAYVSANVGKNVDISSLSFSDSGSKNFQSTRDNISVSDYMSAKRTTATRYI